MINLSLLDLLVIALATWRLTYALLVEQCPFGACDLIRRIAHRVGLGGLFSCVYCLSFWVGALVYVVTVTNSPIRPIGVMIVMSLALSALAVFIQRLHDKLRE